MVSKQSFLLLLILLTSGFLPEAPASVDTGKISELSAGFCDLYSSGNDCDTADHYFHLTATLSFDFIVSSTPATVPATNFKTHYRHSPQTIRAPPSLRIA